MTSSPLILLCVALLACTPQLATAQLSSGDTKAPLSAGMLKLAQNSCNMTGFNACGTTCDIRWKSCTTTLGNRQSNDPAVQRCRNLYKSCVQQCRQQTGC